MNGQPAHSYPQTEMDSLARAKAAAEAERAEVLALHPGTRFEGDRLIVPKPPQIVLKPCTEPGCLNVYGGADEAEASTKLARHMLAAHHVAKMREA